MQGFSVFLWYCLDMKNVAVIAGPSGGGKNSILDALVERYPSCARLVTATTRNPRNGEVDGIDYHFLSTEQFMVALENGDILEHRDVVGLGTHYGVYKPDIDTKLGQGKIVLAHLDIVGARRLKALYGAVAIFVMPDSPEVLEHRIRARNPDMDDAEVMERIAIGKREMEEDVKEYDFTVINAQGRLDAAVDEVAAILTREGYDLK
jgi:guanylate kinase